MGIGSRSCGLESPLGHRSLLVDLGLSQPILLHRVVGVRGGGNEGIENDIVELLWVPSRGEKWHINIFIFCLHAVLSSESAVWNRLKVLLYFRQDFMASVLQGVL